MKLKGASAAASIFCFTLAMFCIVMSCRAYRRDGGWHGPQAPPPSSRPVVGPPSRDCPEGSAWSVLDNSCTAIWTIQCSDELLVVKVHALDLNGDRVELGQIRVPRCPR